MPRPLAANISGLAANLAFRAVYEVRFRDMDRPPRRFEAPPWYWIAAVWTGIALLDAIQTVVVMRAEGMHHYWTRLFFTQLLSWLPFMMVTPLVLRLGYDFPLRRWRSLATWAVHLPACAAIGLISSCWVSLWEEWLNPWAASPGPIPFVDLSLRKFYGGLLSDIILYGLILLIGHILESQQKFARQAAETALLSEQLSRAQLNALRRQIEPHFLFNTLNGIAGLVREQRNDAAVSMIAELSEFLRGVVKDSDRQQIPLKEEVEFTQKYLNIQKSRFGERLTFSIDISPDLLLVEVPSFVLQPMVENAIKHGIAKRAQGGAIRITAAESNGMLTLRVYNEGPALAPFSKHDGFGVGTLNIRSRLESLYGRTFELDLRNKPGGVEASVSVPLVSRRDRSEDSSCGISLAAEGARR